MRRRQRSQSHTTLSPSWITTITTLTFLLSTQPTTQCLASPNPPSPYLPAATAQAAAPPSQALHPRQSTDGSQCLANFYSCSSQGPAFSGACCATNQVCALDAGNQPACCLKGAVCTGLVTGTFVLPTGTAAPVSYYPNTYFSFPYIATTFANPPACTSAFSQCAANAAACTSRLQGGQAAAGGNYGVTVAVPGQNGGPSQTVVGNAPAVSLDASRAQSVCASLSSAACYGIQTGVCTVGNSGVFSVGNSPTSGTDRGRAVVGMQAAAVAGLIASVLGIALI